MRLDRGKQKNLKLISSKAFSESLGWEIHSDEATMLLNMIQLDLSNFGS